jgi:hypothetical protein
MIKIKGWLKKTIIKFQLLIDFLAVWQHWILPLHIKFDS